jgi:hypothetical protein
MASALETFSISKPDSKRWRAARSTRDGRTGPKPMLRLPMSTLPFAGFFIL